MRVFGSFHPLKFKPLHSFLLVYFPRRVSLLSSGQWPVLITATRSEACWCLTCPTEPPLTTLRSGTPRCASECSHTRSCSSWWAKKATWMVTRRGLWAGKRLRSWPDSWGCPMWRLPPSRATTWGRPLSCSLAGSTRVCWAERWSRRRAGMESSVLHHRRWSCTEPAWCSTARLPTRTTRSAAVKLDWQWCTYIHPCSRGTKPSLSGGWICGGMSLYQRDHNETLISFVHHCWYWLKSPFCDFTMLWHFFKWVKI